MLAVPLFADFFPATVEQTIKSINGKNIELSSPFPVTGMSGVVIHRYGTSTQTATIPLVQTQDNGKAVLLNTSLIEKSKLPVIVTKPVAGDKVVGGYLYGNVLLLAPNSSAYNSFKSQYKKEWIHPDLFGVYLSRNGDSVATAENLESFARAYQVGLVAIVMKDSVVLYDPISKYIVGKKMNALNDASINTPFFMRLNAKSKGFFGGENKSDYFETMAKIK
jgi:hypothetical protein